MTALRRLTSAFRRFANLWRGPWLDREFDDELRFHLETRRDANIRGGMAPAAAEAEARRHLGGTLRAKEGMREARVLGWVEAFGRDLRHGARMFRRQPGLAALAVLTLSLGIGANAVMFSLLQAMLLRPLPFADADRLVSVVDGYRAEGVAAVVPPTVPELIDVRARNRSLEGVSFFDTRDFQINGGNEPARVFAARIEASFLAVLGVRPAHGRLLLEGENLPGRDRVVVLTDGLWRRNFGGDPGIIGRQMIVNGGASTIVGVLPPDFSFDYLAPEPIEMYVPFPMNETYTSRHAEFANVRRVTSLARLKRGHSIESASAELQALSRTLATEHPALYRRGSDGRESGFFMDVRPPRAALTEGLRPVLTLLFGAVGLVLLIACVNTAQFLLARAIEREPEVAIRSALGAGRGRLVRQFLSEALLLALAGGAVGLLQAMWLMKALVATLPDRVPMVGEIGLDGRVLAFTAALAMATAVGFGLFPALHFSRTNPGRRLEGRGAGAARTRGRQVLIAVEVSVSVVLLVGAGLLFNSLRELQNAPRGYSADDVTVMRMRVSAGAAPRNGPLGLAYQLYLERIAAIPGVAAAAVADAPLAGFGDVEFSIDGREDDAATLSRQRASYRIVSPDYFSVLRIPLRAGRGFADDDIVGRPPVAIINEQMAGRFWPGQSAIGQRIRAAMGGPRFAVLTVVGIVGDVRPILLPRPMPQIYVSYLQQNEPSINLLVRSEAGAPVSPDAVKKALWSVAPDQPVFNIRPLTEIVADGMAEPRTVAQLLGSFALLALFMSAIGVYTVVTYLTSCRMREIALRRAIGAKALDVLGLLAGQTMRWTFAGLAIGIAAAVAASGLLRVTLAGVTPLDPLTVAAVSLLYLVVVAAAMCIPAARTLRLDPAAVLRAE